MSIKGKFILLLITAAVISLHSQNLNPVSLSVNSGANIPLGPLSEEGYKLYTIGGFAELAAEYTLPFCFQSIRRS